MVKFNLNESYFTEESEVEVRDDNTSSLRSLVPDEYEDEFAHDVVNGHWSQDPVKRDAYLMLKVYEACVDPKGIDIMEDNGTDITNYTWPDGIPVATLAELAGKPDKSLDQKRIWVSLLIPQQIGLIVSESSNQVSMKGNGRGGTINVIKPGPNLETFITGQGNWDMSAVNQEALGYARQLMNNPKFAKFDRKNEADAKNELRSIIRANNGSPDLLTISYWLYEGGLNPNPNPGKVDLRNFMTHEPVVRRSNTQLHIGGVQHSDIDMGGVKKGKFHAIPFNRGNAGTYFTKVPNYDDPADLKIKNNGIKASVDYSSDEENTAAEKQSQEEAELNKNGTVNIEKSASVNWDQFKTDITPSNKKHASVNSEDSIENTSSETTEVPADKPINTEPKDAPFKPSKKAKKKSTFGMVSQPNTKTESLYKPSNTINEGMLVYIDDGSFSDIDGINMFPLFDDPNWTDEKRNHAKAYQREYKYMMGADDEAKEIEYNPVFFTEMCCVNGWSEDEAMEEIFGW